MTDANNVEAVLGAPKYVAVLQEMLARFAPDDQAARYQLYDRARSFVISRLVEQGDRTEAEIDSEVAAFDQAARQVEAQARATTRARQAAAKQPELLINTRRWDPEPTPSSNRRTFDWRSGAAA